MSDTKQLPATCPSPPCGPVRQHWEDHKEVHTAVVKRLDEIKRDMPSKTAQAVILTLVGFVFVMLLGLLGTFLTEHFKDRRAAIGIAAKLYAAEPSSLSQRPDSPTDPVK